MQAEYEVTSAIEEQGFARVVAKGESGSELVTEELSVEVHGAIVRLKEGDVVSGTVRGRRLVGARLVRAKAPPAADVAALVGLVAELRAFGFAVTADVTDIATREWRRDPKRMRAKHPVLGAMIRAQLEWLTEADDEGNHPPADPEVVRAKNEALAAAKSDKRWCELGDAHVLVVPEAGRLLRDHVFRVVDGAPGL